MRHIRLIGPAIVAGLLLTGVAGAQAGTKSTATTRTATTKVTCVTTLTDTIPQGDTGVTPDDTEGRQAGQVVCHKLLGPGMQTDRFKIADTGDASGTYTQYFGTGTVRGKYRLTPADSQPSSTTTFASTSYAGTITITGGTGAYRGVKGKGTETCSTSDGVHTSCTEKLKVKLPAA